MKIPSSILPASKDDRARWRVQAQRQRLLSGDFSDDVREDIRRLFAAEVAADLELAPDTSRNTFLMVTQQLSQNYTKAPAITTDDDADLSPIVTPRLWPTQRANELKTRALGESIIKVDWSADGEVGYQIIDPATVVLTPDPDRPDRPIAVEWLRLRAHDVWTWEIWNAQDGTFRIEAQDDRGVRHDVTNDYAPDLAGAYPHQDEEGFILPFVLYHSEIGARLWNYTTGAELVSSTLRACSLWSSWQEGFVNSAHPQRYALDADSQAGVTRNINGVSVDVIPVDRKSILKFRSTGQGGSSLSQFAPAMEPRSAADALNTYESGLAIYAGLNPSDLQTTGAQSGYAIVVSRDGQRRKAQEIAPALMMSDQLLLATAARLANLYGGASLPTASRDYSIKYRGLEESAAERKQQADTVAQEMALGLISRVEALRRLNPEIPTDAAAVERLLTIDQTNQILSAPKEVINE